MKAPAKRRRTPRRKRTGHVDYDAYLRSDAWHARRDMIKARDGHRCRMCNAHESDTGLDVHHRTYERLGREEPADLVTLCRACHELHHGRGASKLEYDAGFRAGVVSGFAEAKRGALGVTAEPYALELACPLCEGDAYVHPERVSVNAGGRVLIVDAKGFRKQMARALGRGVAIDVAYACEDGHRFAIRQLFHKGKTFVWTHDAKVCAEGEPPRVIWRT